MLDRSFHLAIDGSDAPLPVLGLHGSERIHAPFRFVVDCAVAAEDASGAADWLGEKAHLTWHLGGGQDRSLTAIVDAVHARHGAVRIELVPLVAAASDAADHRVFVDMHTVEIAEKILSEHGISLDDRVARTLPKRAQCIQSFESDLDFVSRLLADEGIAWFLTPDGEKLALSDSPGAFDDDGLSLRVAEEAGMVAGPAVFRAHLARRIAPDEVALADYDFTKPAVDQTARSSAGDKGLRQHVYPGRHADPSLGRERAKLRLEATRNRQQRLSAATTHPGLRPGLVVDLTGDSPSGVAGKWLIVDIEHEAKDAAGSERPYEARFLAVPADVGYRPTPTLSPRLGGVQTATVAGASGAEIHPDPHTRVRVAHRHDHRAPGDDKSSAWARTVQPATSGGVLLPRVGWESLVAFGAGDGDDPWVLGRLDNGVARPAESLPAKKVWSALGTPTSPGGGSANRFAIDDTAGNEGMHLGASAQYSETTANDKVTSIQADDTHVIGSDRSLEVAKVFETGVTGARTLTVGGSRETSIVADDNVTASSETVLVGGLRLITTGGDLSNKSSVFVRIVAGGHVELPIEHQSRLVVGGSAVIHGAGWATAAAAGFSVGVGGASALAVAGPKSVTCTEYGVESKVLLSETYAARSAKAGGNIEGDYAGSLSITAGPMSWTAPTIVFSATAIAINAGGCAIQITSGGVTIQGAVSSSVNSTQGGSAIIT
ncbi:MAG: type VI secretion system tip protein TssI/VgrG [Polyangiaceae bacterium]